MFEVISAAVLLGVTAGLCPICYVFITPIIPHLTSKSHNVKGALRTTVSFALGLAVVFVPLGGFASFAVNLLTVGVKGWVYMVAAALSIFVGLWALRVVRLPYRQICKNVKPPLLGAGVFAYGISYGATTFARGAPLLLSIISISAVNGDFVLGSLSLFIYALMMGAPLVLLSILFGSMRVRDLIARNSRRLDTASGFLLVGIGIYYLGRALLFY